jgi:hypothetical protein
MFAKHRIKPRYATAEELDELVGIPAAERREAIRRMFRAGILVPLAGGSPEGDDGGAGDGDGDGDGAGDDGDEGGKDDGDDGDGDAGDDDVKVKFAKAEKAAADKDRELRKLRREQEDRDRKARESDGKFEELYKDEKTRADRLEKELEDFKAGVEEEKRSTTAKSQAVAALKAAGVKNPERDVVHLDLSKIDSETAAKRAAKKFADDNPDLLDKAPTRQKRGGGDGDDDGGSNGSGDKVLGPDRLRRHFAKS